MHVMNHQSCKSEDKHALIKYCVHIPASGFLLIDSWWQ